MSVRPHLLGLLLATSPALARGDELAAAINGVAQGSRPAVDRAITRIQFLGTPRSAVHALAEMAQGRREGNRDSAAYALSVLHPPDAVPVLLELLPDEDAQIRVSACIGLSHSAPQPKQGAAVAERLTDPVAGVRRACARAAAVWGLKAAEKPLLTALKGEADPDARLAEVDALGHVGSGATAALLEPLLNSDDDELRWTAGGALARLGSPAGRKAVEAWAAQPDAHLRHKAVEIAAGLPLPWAGELLTRATQDPKAGVALLAAHTLIDRKDARGLKGLVLRAEKATAEETPSFDEAFAELKISQKQRLDLLQAAGAAKPDLAPSPKDARP
jgi:HEAT repeat protein